MAQLLSASARFFFDIPTNGFIDAAGPFDSSPGSIPADHSKPFTGVLSDFEDLPYSGSSNADVIDVFDGSAGGKWLDISGTGLSQVGFVRFSVSDDADALTGLNFELDAVSVASSAIGGVVPEPSSLIMVVVGAGLLLRVPRRVPDQRNGSAPFIH